MKKVLIVSALALSAAALGAVLVERSQFILVDTGQRFDTEEACIAAATATLGAAPRDCIQRTVVLGSCADIPQPAGFEAELLTTECPEGSNSPYRLDETYMLQIPYSTDPATGNTKCWKKATRLLWACSWKPPAPPDPSELIELHPLSNEPPPADWTPMPPDEPCPPEYEMYGSPAVCKRPVP